MPTKRTEHDHAGPPTVRTRPCRTCEKKFPTGQLVHGECPDCAGLDALPLRGAGGRFLPGLAVKPVPSGPAVKPSPKPSGGRP
jgi:hypothetical protein